MCDKNKNITYCVMRYMLYFRDKVRQIYRLEAEKYDLQINLKISAI